MSNSYQKFKYVNSSYLKIYLFHKKQAGAIHSPACLYSNNKG
ncbi:hypothetical protein VRK_17800 [Vibrio sp. MEBiC08052]|nr:hypothetical protein VRK_17800 [Vibrio sp. MEBiC08052]